MATQVAAARQPFAPLNCSRLQNLTSLKNRQNALSNTLSSPTKRKATIFDFDSLDTNDSENIDPSIFLSPKRSKAADGSSKDTFVKPTNFFLAKVPPSPPAPNEFSSLNPATSPRRPILAARSQAIRLNTTISKSSPLSAAAGRSPTRKRIGILNRRKTASPFTRIDPPKFSTPSSSGLGFSIDAALSGTIPSYRARQATKEVPVSLHEPETKSSWFFDIHEDTPEEEATNLMEHSTCTLDISSDEESAQRSRDERGKENVPPPDDISQTRTQINDVTAGESSMADIKARIRESRRRRRDIDEDACDIDRSPLGGLAAENFYAEGCDGSSVFLIPSDEHSEDIHQEQEQEQVVVEENAGLPETTFDFEAEVKSKGKEVEVDVDALMQSNVFDAAPKAALLEPIEKAEENFEVWESGSAKGDE